MRRYILDTTPLTALLNQRPAAVGLLTPWLRAGELSTSIIVYGEVIESFYRYPDFARRRRMLRALLREVPPFPLNYSTMERYTLILRQLRPPYGPGLIDDTDSLIAATALVRGLTLVTTDGDFRRVSGLSLILLDRTTLAPMPT